MGSPALFLFQEDSLMSSVTEEFGSLVFSDTTMKEKLPKETYRAMQLTIKI